MLWRGSCDHDASWDGGSFGRGELDDGWEGRLGLRTCGLFRKWRTDMDFIGMQEYYRTRVLPSLGNREGMKRVAEKIHGEIHGLFRHALNKMTSY